MDFRTLSRLALPFAVAIVPITVRAQSGGWRLIDTKYGDVDTRGVKAGTNTIEWIDRPSAAGGRVRVTMRNGGCAGGQEEFTLSWRFDRDIRHVAPGGEFRVMPSVEKRTAGEACADLGFVSVAGDDGGTIVPLANGISPQGEYRVFNATENSGTRYYPPQYRAPPTSGVLIKASERATPRPGWFSLNMEVWGGFMLNVVYVYGGEPAAAPPAPPVNTGLRADYKLTDVKFADIDTRGVAAGINRMEWLERPSARGGRLRVTMRNGGCAGGQEQFILTWRFDHNISGVNHGQEFHVTPTVEKSNPGPACADLASAFAAGDGNGVIVDLARGVLPQGAFPVFSATTNYGARYVPTQYRPAPEGGIGLKVTDRTDARRGYFALLMEVWGGFLLNVVYIYDAQ